MEKEREAKWERERAMDAAFEQELEARRQARLAARQPAKPNFAGRREAVLKWMPLARQAAPAPFDENSEGFDLWSNVNIMAALLQIQGNLRGDR